MLTLSLAAVALAADPVAVAVAVRGTVTLSAEGERALPPFAKVREGDTLRVAAGAALDLVWLSDARLEAVSGPVVVVVAVREDPTVATFGPSVGEALLAASERVSGSAVVRGGPPPDVERRRASALATRDALREMLPEPEPLPDLWLASALASLEVPDDELAGAVAEAAKRCPGCREVDALAALLAPVDPPWCRDRASEAVDALRAGDGEEAWRIADAAGLRCASLGLRTPSRGDPEERALRRAALRGQADAATLREAADPHSEAERWAQAERLFERPVLYGTGG